MIANRRASGASPTRHIPARTPSLSVAASRSGFFRFVSNFFGWVLQPATIKKFFARIPGKTSDRARQAVGFHFIRFFLLVLDVHLGQESGKGCERLRFIIRHYARWVVGVGVIGACGCETIILVFKPSSRRPGTFAPCLSLSFLPGRRPAESRPSFAATTQKLRHERWT